MNLGMQAPPNCPLTKLHPGIAAPRRSALAGVARRLERQWMRSENIDLSISFFCCLVVHVLYYGYSFAYFMSILMPGPMVGVMVRERINGSLIPLGRASFRAWIWEV